MLNVLAAALAGSNIASALVPVTPPRLSPRIASRSPMGPSVAQPKATMAMSTSMSGPSMDRRAAINRAIGGGAAVAAAAAVLGGAPSPSLAAGYKMVEDEGLLRYLYLIKRVQEACSQETRLITTGKFKDLQRANIKLAATMMLRNYQLADTVVLAAKYAKAGKAMDASAAGNAAVDALQQINEYFDSDVGSLKVTNLSPDKQAFVLKALKTATASLDQFMEYMPSDVVEQATVQVEEENMQNLKDFKGEGYLNPSPNQPRISSGDALKAQAAAEKAQTNAADQVQTAPSASAPLAAPQMPPPPAENDPWTQVTQDGRTFWYNKKTGVSSWTRQ